MAVAVRFGINRLRLGVRRFWLLVLPDLWAVAPWGCAPYRAGSTFSGARSRGIVPVDGPVRDRASVPGLVASGSGQKPPNCPVYVGGVRGRVCDDLQQFHELVLRLGQFPLHPTSSSSSRSEDKRAAFRRKRT